jgi:hypothetical protein
MEPEMYQHLKMIANLQKISMSKIIRDGVKLKFA